MAEEMGQQHEGKVDPFHLPYSPLLWQGHEPVVPPDTGVFGIRFPRELPVQDEAAS